jgi:CRISPR associated protein
MVELRPANGIVARDVLLRIDDHADRYAIHAALDEHFGRRSEVGYLWCVGQVAEGTAARVRLPPTHPNGESGIAIKAPHAGAALAFRLRANITRKIGRSAERRSWPRDELAPRLRWLERRGAEHGFQVEQVEASNARVFIGKAKGFWIDETTFTGKLIVVDRDQFAAALSGGVGQRSAFGCGLLETF